MSDTCAASFLIDTGNDNAGASRHLASVHHLFHAWLVAWLPCAFIEILWLCVFICRASAKLHLLSTFQPLLYTVICAQSFTTFGLGFLIWMILWLESKWKKKRSKRIMDTIRGPLNSTRKWLRITFGLEVDVHQFNGDFARTLMHSSI